MLFLISIYQLSTYTPVPQPFEAILNFSYLSTDY